MKAEDFVKLNRTIPRINAIVLTVWVCALIVGWFIFLVTITVPLFLWAVFDLPGARNFADRINDAMAAQLERVSNAAMRLSRPKTDATNQKEYE